MINRMKRFLFVILALVVAVFFAGCGEYVYAPNRPSSNNSQSGSTGGSGNGNSGNQGGGNQGGNTDGGNQGGGNQGGNTGGDNGDGNSGDNEEKRVFTATLVKNGVTYTNTNGIKAQWVSKYGVYSADFVNGVATISGLDGEYHVTLSALPQERYTEYTYDCNGYIVNNSKRDVKIELLEILTAYRSLNGWFEIQTMGTYRATVNSRTSETMYYFYPQKDGWYSITSWVDTTANTINPKVKIYNGNAFSGFYVLDKTVDKGGSESTYTKNFRFEVKINWDEVGNNQIFGIMADSADGKYSVTVDFTVKYEGEYIRQDFGDPVYANGPFLNTRPSGSFRYAYTDDYKGINSGGYATYILDGSKVRLKESGENAGIYHLYDEGKYASNGGWGPMLFAKLIQDSYIMWTYDDKGVHLDMGFNYNHLNDGMVSCIINGYDYAYMITNSKDDDGVQHIGYANYCNSDGAHPVTEEIKNFLQAYATREWFFDDGEGFAENGELNAKWNSAGTAIVQDGISLQASENDQWLFACGYYR